MKLLTGNDLKTGAVTWWTGSDWSIHVDDAVDVTGQEDEIASREEAARRIQSARCTRVDCALRSFQRCCRVLLARVNSVNCSVILGAARIPTATKLLLYIKNKVKL